MTRWEQASSTATGSRGGMAVRAPDAPLAPATHKQDMLACFSLWKRKYSHCLCSFPELWQKERKGRNRDTAVKSLPQALPLTRAGKRRGLCSFTLPRTPLSCLAHSRMSGTWVNHSSRNSPTIFLRNSLRLDPLPSLSHILGELWTSVLWDCLTKVILAQRGVTCLPVLKEKKL